MRGLASLVEDEKRTINDFGDPWVGRAGGSNAVDQWSAFNLSAVWACETLIADAIATLPVDTFKKSGSARVETPKPTWIDAPNPENNRIDYETQRLLSLLGWGNAYSFLLRKDGSTDPMAPVIERWLLNPANVFVQRIRAYDETSQLNYWVHGIQVPRTNIQHIRGYVPPGQFLGMSVIQNASRGLEMTVAAEVAGQTLYNQGMSHGGVVEIPQMPAEVSTEVTDRIRDNVMKNNAGANNAGKPLILTGGSHWQSMMLSPSDAQYLETRKFQINEICRWFRVPPHKIADIVAHASQGGGMGIEQQASEFAQDTLLSWVNRLEIADTALLPGNSARMLLGEEVVGFVKYNLNAYVRADLATQITSFKEGILGGWYCLDDVLQLMDQPPLPDGMGKVRLRPANYVPIDTPAGSIAPDPTQGALQ